MVNVNCSAMIFLTAAVVGSMESRKTGLIINIASDFGRLPAPLVALYGATKAFVIHFSKCIRYEYAPSNIHVQCVCPMFVCTKMSGMKRSSFLIPMPEKFVQHALCSATRLKVSLHPHSKRVRLSDGHLTRIPYGAVLSQRPSLPRTPVYNDS